MGRSGREVILKYVFKIIVYGLFGFLLFPLFVLVAISFTELNYLTFPPQGFTLKWYAEVFQDKSYVDAFMFSIKLALFATLISLIIGIPASKVNAQINFPGKKLFNHLISSPLLLPQIVFGVALLQFFYLFTNIPQNFWALTAGHVIITLPYVIRTCTATFVGMGKSVEEAAWDLGANKTETFFLVTLPLIKTGAIASGLFSFAISWINVEVSIFLTSTSNMALPVKMFNYVQYNIDPLIAAVSAITIYLAFILIIVIDYLVGIENVG